jgi:HlyD family secretion protein
MRNRVIFISGLILVLVSALCKVKEAQPIKASGVVDGDVITVKTLAGGSADKVNIREGARVNKDDILVEINSEKLQVQMQGLDIREEELPVSRKKLENRKVFLRSNLDYWESQVQKFKRLSQKESISEDEVKKAELKLEEVKTSLFEVNQSLSELSIQSESIKNQKEQLMLQIKDYIVTSPVTGVVLERFISQGETVFPGTAVADILDQDSLFIETFLEEEEISGLLLGQEVSILLDGEQTPYEGEIINFGREAEFSPKYIISEKERKSLLYKVKVRIKGPMEKFKLGMPVTIIINGSTV